MEKVDIVTMPNQYDYNGIHLNKAYHPPEFMDACRALKLKQDDVAIIKYPRTGGLLSILLLTAEKTLNNQPHLVFKFSF